MAKNATPDGTRLQKNEMKVSGALLPIVENEMNLHFVSAVSAAISVPRPSSLSLVVKKSITRTHFIYTQSGLVGVGVPWSRCSHLWLSFVLCSSGESLSSLNPLVYFVSVRADGSKCALHRRLETASLRNRSV